MRSAEPRTLTETRERQARALVAGTETADAATLLQLLSESLATKDSLRNQRTALRAAISIMTVEVGDQVYYRVRNGDALVRMPDGVRASIDSVLAGVRRPGVRQRHGPRSKASA